MDERETQEKEKKIYTISGKKVFITSLVLSVITGIILFGILLAVFVTKILFNISGQAADMEGAILQASENYDYDQSDRQAKYSALAAYLSHYENHHEISYEELVNIAGRYYPDALCFVLSPEGEMKTAVPKDVDMDVFDPKEIASLADSYDPDSEAPLFIYYSVYYGKLSDGSYVVVMDDHTVPGMQEDEIYTLEQAIEAVMKDNAESDTQSYGFISFGQNGMIYTADHVYMPNEKPELDFEPEKGVRVTFSDGAECYVNLLKINGKNYLAASKYNKDNDIWTHYCSVPMAEIRSDLNITIVVQLVFMMLLTAMAFYNYYLRQFSRLHPDDPSYSKSIRTRKMIIGLIISTLVIGGTAHYAQTLFSLSINVLDDNKRLESIKEDYAVNQNRAERVSAYFKQENVAAAQMLGEYFGTYPESRTKEELSELASKMSLNYIILYDIEGKLTESSGDIRNYSFPNDKDNPASEFNQLKIGLPSVSVDVEQNELTGEPGIRTAVNIYDSSHEPAGYLEICSNSEILSKIIRNSYLEAGLRNTMISGNSVTYYVINSGTGVIEISNETYAAGMLASEYGFSEESLKSGFFGKIKLGYESCYVSSMQVEDKIMILAHPEYQVYLSRVPYTAAAMILFLLDMMVILYVLRDKRKGYDAVSYGEEKLLQPAEEPEDETENKGLLKTISHRIVNLFELRDDATPEKKLARIVETGIEICAVLLALIFMHRYFTRTGNSLMIRIAEGRWAKGLNVFSMTANMMLILFGILVTVLIRWLLTMAGEISDSRGETIMRLMRNATNYIAFLTILYFCLINIGIDPSSLITSAGLLGVAIGIGARDLITDIIAGLFIMFEGTFQVGDIVEAHGYQGMVREIGLRTTRIRGWDMNQKIVNNREMTNVINMSSGNYYTIFRFSVPSNVPEDDLKHMFAEILPSYTERYPDLVTVPSFTISEPKLSGISECYVVAEISGISTALTEQKIAQDIQNLLNEYGVSFRWKGTENVGRKM